MPWTDYPWIDENNPGQTPILSSVLKSEFARAAAYAESLGGGGGAAGPRIVTVAASGTSYALALASDKDVLLLLTLTANCTITVTGLTAGAAFTIELRQDATGGRVPILPAATKPGGALPPLSTTANAVDVVSFYSPDGTILRSALVGANFS